MQYMRICSSTTVAGHVVSPASMPRVSLLRDFPHAFEVPAAMVAYRTAVVERHLREHLQRGSDGNYFSSRGISLWELIVQSLASEQHLDGAAVVAVIEEVRRLLKEDGHEAAAAPTCDSLVAVSAAHRTAIGVALVTCGHGLSELTADEKRMTWLGHPQWLAEDRTTAAELLALLTVRRVKSMQFI
ncbi:MAG: hypothetical protein WCT03_08640 [Candidatus Obscuribacterales bacterium]